MGDNRWEPVQEFFHQPGLTDTRRGNQAYQERTSLLDHPSRQELELRNIRITADERHATHHGHGLGAHQRQCGYRRGFALCIDPPGCSEIKAWSRVSRTL